MWICDLVIWGYVRAFEVLGKSGCESWSSGVAVRESIKKLTESFAMNSSVIGQCDQNMSRLALQSTLQ